MTWRERLGRADERAAVAARARELVASVAVPPPPAAPPSAGPDGPSPRPGRSGVRAGADTLPVGAVGSSAPGCRPPRGGWVPAEPPDGLPVDLLLTGVLPAGDLARSDGDGGDDGEDDGDDPHRSDHGNDGGNDHGGSAPGSAASRWLHAAGVAGAGSDRTGWRDRWERLRLDPGRRGMAAVAAVVVVVAATAGGLLVTSGPGSAVVVGAAVGPAPSVAGRSGASSSGTPAAGSSPAPVSPGPAAAGSASASPAAPSGVVVVDVAGLVVRPGVYRLPAGSRVEDALAAAGGPLPGADLSSVNRARVLVDGEQLAIGVPGAPGGPLAVPSVGSTAATGGVVDLNTADLTALETLPGVGPVLAQHILDWRTAHGKFSAVADLQQVSGIGPSRFADLKDLVTV